MRTIGAALSFMGAVSVAFLGLGIPEHLTFETYAPSAVIALSLAVVSMAFNRFYRYWVPMVILVLVGDFSCFNNEMLLFAPLIPLIFSGCLAWGLADAADKREVVRRGLAKI